MTWNTNFPKYLMLFPLSPIGQYLLHSFDSRIGPSIIWNLVKTEPCMTSSFHETKTSDRTSKHHYNDILTNMQTRAYHPLISREREAHNTLAMHTAVSPSNTTQAGPEPSQWSFSLAVFHEEVSLISDHTARLTLLTFTSLCVSPPAGCWLSYFKWQRIAEQSIAELSWA